ncbi:TIM barrel protein [Candidatus Pelagibacter sp.]|nr:TIM barrel protein [Candidatus Pelagibacter sp.]|tara:strand:+ start:6431 stop:7195 length:765 start_codon:yes stop_codon:yes gene_type:complete
MQGRICQDNLNLLNPYPAKPLSEFKIAKKYKLSHIELITEESYNKENYIWSDEKIKLLNNEFIKNNQKKLFFIDNFSIKNPLCENHDYYQKLLNQLSKLKVKNFTLPLYGKSMGIFNLKFIKALYNISDLCSQLNINFLIETNISFKKYKILKKKLETKNLGIVFDVGNRSLENKFCYNEIKEFNKEIKHIHLKDRNISGKNVLLGSGIVKFDQILNSIRSIGYKKYFTLETNRYSKPILSLEKNLNFLGNLFK